MTPELPERPHPESPSPDEQADTSTPNSTPTTARSSDSAGARPRGAHRAARAETGRWARLEAALSRLPGSENDPHSYEGQHRTGRRRRATQLGGAALAAGLLATAAYAAVPQDDAQVRAASNSMAAFEQQAPAATERGPAALSNPTAKIADRAEKAAAAAEQRLQTWSQTSATSAGIPARALEAYVNAEHALAQQRPECKLPWQLLAGIGSVESVHGQFNGATLQPDGRPSVPIIGVALDGSAGNWAISDTDGGALDGDTATDRAVGPMQFIPSTWKTWGIDGNADGTIDPQSLDDAAASAGNYLCGDQGHDLSSAAAQADALFTYNNSTSYGQQVLDNAAKYLQSTPPAPARS